MDHTTSERAIVVCETADASPAETVSRAVTGFSTRLVAFLYRLVGDRARAHDLAQETFLRLHQRLNGEPRSGNLKSFVFAIAANLGRDELRRRRARREVAVLSAAEADAGAPSPQAALEREERQRLVRAALERLPPSARVLLTLRDVEGLAYTEIADALGVPLGTVKSRISRARLAFRDAWTACGGAREEQS